MSRARESDAGGARASAGAESPGGGGRWAMGCLLLGLVCSVLWTGQAADTPPLRKVRDLVIYREDRFYAAFPSVVRRPDGELLVAFRRAPERRCFGEAQTTHTDPCSQLVLVRSKDGGHSWTRQPELLFAHPLGGSQDPCLLQLRDGSLLGSSYGWALLDSARAAAMTNSLRHGPFVFLGGWLLRSEDGGRSWAELPAPPHVPGDVTCDALGRPTAAFNRGALCEAADGHLYWVVAVHPDLSPRRAEAHLLVSADRGQSWRYGCPVARDPKVTFNESSLYQTPSGDLVAFLRTANFDDHTVVARSTDGGRSFQPWQDTGWRGHPHYALRLPDRRVLLVYGYRHAPFGIRARVLEAECTNAATAPEIVLRDDGGNGDLGYPWATLLSAEEALVVYYFNVGNGPRHIAGTVVRVRP